MRTHPRLTRALSLLAVPFLLITAAQPASAIADVADPPGPWLRTTVERIRKLATRTVKPDSPEEEQWKKDVKAAVDEILDWPELTKLALGRNWKERTPAEQQSFSKLLREMIETSYQSKLKLAARGKINKPAEVKLDWAKEEVTGEKAQALAKIQADKTKSDLLFKLRWDGKRWRVYDLSIDDVSSVSTYRSQFGKIIDKDGFPALIKRMEKKVVELREGKGELAP